MKKKLKNIQTFEQHTNKNLNISDVSDSDLVEHTLEDENGNKFCVKLPEDAKNIKFVESPFDGSKYVYFYTKFGGKKYLETYIEI